MTVDFIEAHMERGLKYSEKNGLIDTSLPRRDCCLWQTGVDEPVSSLEVLSFRQRFGAVVIPAEGIGGVETLPQFHFIQSTFYATLLEASSWRHPPPLRLRFGAWSKRSNKSKEKNPC